MPFTARQRRFFHAAASRGEKGMHALAKEADHSETLPPVHEAQCYACGGRVNAMGMAEGGEVGEGYETEAEEAAEPYEGGHPENDDGDSSQMESAENDEQKARRAFVAMRRG